MVDTCLITDYPKGFKENLVFRRELYNKASKNSSLQSHLRAICAKDVLFFVNVFVFTYDPRRQIIKRLPFITYPFQDDVFLWDKECLVEHKDELVEKSRDMGATWIFAISDVHDWLFHKEKIEILWGSRKEAYIDSRGDMKTIFEKFRYCLRCLPSWLLPLGFEFDKHDNTMRLINPDTGSAIVGEATNPNFSRGGRFSRIRFDEYAFWDCAEEAWQSAADATNCRTALSTVNGSSNKFAQLAKSGNIEMRTLHWTMHPRKQKGVYIVQNGKNVPISLEHDTLAAYKIWTDNRNVIPPAHFVGGIVRSEWYDRECQRRNDVKEVAEELDIDYLRSGLPFFDLRRVNQQIKCQYYERKQPTDQIQAGKYIKANLVEVDHKIELREEISGWCKIYELPKHYGQYVVGGDPAEGLLKGDDSFAVVRDKSTRNVVATVKGKYDPDDFALKVQKLGKYYNEANVAVENNNMGYSVNSDLKQLDCNLYWTKKKNPDGTITKVKAGWTTTAQSRPLMLAQSKEDVRQISCEIRDSDILNQMTTFVHNEKSGKPEADGDFLDDGVLAFSIAGQVLIEEPFKHKKERAPRENAHAAGNKNGGFRFGKK